MITPDNSGCSQAACAAADAIMALDGLAPMRQTSTPDVIGWFTGELARIIDREFRLAGKPASAPTPYVSPAIARAIAGDPSGAMSAGELFSQFKPASK